MEWRPGGETGEVVAETGRTALATGTGRTGYYRCPEKTETLDLHPGRLHYQLQVGHSWCEYFCAVKCK